MGILSINRWGDGRWYSTYGDINDTDINHKWWLVKNDFPKFMDYESPKVIVASMIPHNTVYVLLKMNIYVNLQN